MKSGVATLENALIVAHTQGMIRPTIVVFACPKCRLAYQTTQLHRSNKVVGEFICMKCKELVHSWESVYDYVVWKPIKIKRPGGKQKPKRRVQGSDRR